MSKVYFTSENNIFSYKDIQRLSVFYLNTIHIFLCGQIKIKVYFTSQQNMFSEGDI